MRVDGNPGQNNKLQYGVYAMRSDGNKNCVPKVLAAQFPPPPPPPPLLKLRWVGQELEAQTILEALDDARLQPPLPGDRRKRSHSHWAVSQETSPVYAGLPRALCMPTLCARQIRGIEHGSDL